MYPSNTDGRPALKGVVHATGEDVRFRPGDKIRILTRAPIGHYRVPTYIRGKRGIVEAAIMPPGINNEEEGFGRNAGERRHYYRLAVAMKEVWPDYQGPGIDGLRIEVFETWLEGTES